MDQRQLEKERIRLSREITMLESQLDAALRGKEEKLEENKQIKEEITQLEEENKALEEETRRLDEEIAGLDEEFKEAQLGAGRLRREIKLDIERAETEKRQAAEMRTQIARLEKSLESLRREVKQELDDRRNLEAKLRKTNAHIDSMKGHKMAGYVTRQLEKQDWFTRMEEPVPIPEEEAIPVVEATPPEPPPAPEPAEVVSEGKKEEEEGIDFTVG